MKICPNCKTSNDDNTVFCTTCGTKLGSLLSRTSALLKFCTTCGTKLTAEDRFCQNCGTPVDGADVDTPETPVAPVQTPINSQTDSASSESEIDEEAANIVSCNYINKDGYCYFYMSFYNYDGEEDCDLAKKVYDYCLANFEWFTKDGEDDSNDWGDGFSLDGGTIANAGLGDGLKISPTQDFLEYIFNKFEPFRMTAQNIQDYSCEDFANNFIQFYDTVDEELTQLFSKQFAGSTDFDFYLDSSYGYPFYQGSFKMLYPMFRSKTTGNVFTATEPLQVHASNDSLEFVYEIINDEDVHFTFNCATAITENGETATNIYNIAGFDGNFSDVVADVLGEDFYEDEESDDWNDYEFAGFDERYPDW